MRGPAQGRSLRNLRRKAPEMRFAGDNRCGGGAARQPVVRPLFSAAFWATLAFVTWTAFRLGQVRMQPDAIASSVPGFLSRLILRPLDLILQGGLAVLPSPFAMQAAVVAAALAAITHELQLQRPSLGGDAA
ncbi:hypothetical protein [Tropicimonas sp.]|uniref:hypothetical protein n=1 Tax=Tropicimonas sp. TaxID=2067044 RepID=UPI003A87EBA6